MKRIPLFHADMFTAQGVGTPEQHTDLLNRILIEQKTTPSVTRTNDGCWRTSKWWEGTEWLGEAVCNLADEACNHYAQLDPAFAQYRGKYTFASNTNVNQPGSRNVFHNHKTAVFSAVYYLMATDTGPLRLVNPANVMTDCNVGSPFVRDFYFAPKERDLVLWPAWVPHEVEPNKSDLVRVNINFDIFFAS
jgi:hypothetical protein